MAKQKAPSGWSGEDLLLAAMGDVVGAVLVLDADLGVRVATPEARELLGVPIPDGVSAPKLICGGAIDRPIAEALAQGRPTSGVVARPGPSGTELLLSVRATPIAREGKRVGWVMLLSAREAPGEGSHEPVVFHDMWTRDPGMKQVFHVIERAARRDSSVLVRGETGSGKELVARALHRLSPKRHSGPFRAINCAALPANLLESELFGHVRGAFTGAVKDAEGHFRAAHGGTLFLDEVGEMPPELQAKLLRVLETRSVIPVGGRSPIAVDVRIVAATHRSLRVAVEEGRFRADLMYRLRVVPLFIPPLRARREDVMLLAHRFIDELNEEGDRRILRVAPGARAILEEWAWPGNVRELRNVLEYAFVVGEGPVLVEADLPPELRGESAAASQSSRINAAPAAAESDSPEVARIRRALERAGSREGAAKMLGMSRVTLWRRIKELEIDL